MPLPHGARRSTLPQNARKTPQTLNISMVGLVTSRALSRGPLWLRSHNGSGFLYYFAQLISSMGLSE